MPTNHPHRGFSRAALAAGAAWCSVSLLSIIEREPAAYLDVLVLVPILLTLLAFVLLHRVQRASLGRFGVITFWLSAGGMSAASLGQVAIVLGIDRLVWLSFPVGALSWFVGFALYGIATIRAGALPSWAGASLALSEPLTILAALALSPLIPLADHGSFTGAIAHGLIWLALGRRVLHRLAVPFAQESQRWMGRALIA